jgi:predicted nucleotide-binding protein
MDAYLRGSSKKQSSPSETRTSIIARVPMNAKEMPAAIAASSTRPAVFVGSSSEGLDFARAVRGSLDNDAEITLWDEVSGLSETFVESLTTALPRFDFAVLVFTGDDIVRSRSNEMFGPRDNVIFELGLFIGKLGRDRTFVLRQAGAQLKIPSDLTGVTTADYHWPREDKSHRKAVASACDRIRERIRSIGESSRNSDSDAGLDLTRVHECNGVMWTRVSGCEIRVVNGRVEDYAAESTTAMVLPCNEYFDDLCAYDTKSALGAYVNRVFDGEVDAFIALSKDECRKRLGAGVEHQKTADERGVSFGAGRAILLLKPLGHAAPVALVSTTTQRSGQGLAAKVSYLFDGICELVARLVDARLREVAMPILGAGHGRIDPSLAFVGLLLAVAEAARYGQGGQPLTRVTIVVFKRDADSPAQVDPVVVRRALALVGSRD